MPKINKIKVSVVVPIYGVEKYLRQSLDAMVAQTLQDMEFILVDDGSPDKCPEICDEYAARDKRFRVIHQKNGGMGNAYNNGIAAAVGEYIGMAEPDDWMEPDMYELLYAQAKKFDADLVKCPFFYYNSFTNPKDHIDKNLSLEKWAPENKVFSIYEYPEILLCHSSVWASLFRSKIIKTIRFSETRGASYQDFPFMIEGFVKSPRIVTVHKHLIHYRQEPGNMSSITRTDARCMLMVTQCEIARDILEKYHALDKLQSEFYLAAFIANKGLFSRIQSQYKKKYFDLLHNLFAPLKDNISFQYKYFNYGDKLMLDAIINNNYNMALKYTKHTSEYKLFGIPLLTIKYRFPKISVSCFGIQIFKTMETTRHKKYYLFGVKIFSKKVKH